jgi:hypothetical protein
MVSGLDSTRMGIDALTRLLPSDLHPALQSHECKAVVDLWIERLVTFQLAMNAFDGRPLPVQLICETAARYCEALAALTERVVAVSVERDSAGQVRH